MAGFAIGAAVFGSPAPGFAESSLDADVMAQCQGFSKIQPLVLVYDHGPGGCQFAGTGAGWAGGTLTIYPDRSGYQVCVHGEGFTGGASQYLNTTVCHAPQGPPPTQTPSPPVETATPPSPSQESSNAPSATSNGGSGPVPTVTDGGLPPFNFAVIGGGTRDVVLNADGTARINGVFHVFKAGDTISTNGFTGAIIRMPYAAPIQLAPNARFTIGGTCQGHPALGTLTEGNVHVLETTPVEGATIFNVQSSSQPLCIKPRGTEFIVEATGSSARVIVLSGRVTVSDSLNESVDVLAGHQLAVSGQLNTYALKPISSVDRWWEREASPLEFLAAAAAVLILVNLGILAFFWRGGRLRRVAATGGVR